MSNETRRTELVSVDVPPDVTEKAVELADRENLAIGDAIDRLVDVVPEWDYPTEIVERGLGSDQKDRQEPGQ